MQGQRIARAVAPLAAVALALTACTESGESADAPPPETVTTEVQPPETVTETAEESAPTQTVTEDPGECSTDVTTSDFGPHLAASMVQLGELGDQPWEVSPVQDFYYHFQIKEDGYDSCLPLSYVALEGSNGDAEGSAGTGASIADAVVFFHFGEMITNPAPFEMKTVESVERLSDSELQVNYGHAGGATAEGVTEYYSPTFFYNDGLSASGDLPDGVDGHARLYL